MVYTHSDGYPAHANAKHDCGTCNGFGICDDGHYAPMFVLCPECIDVHVPEDAELGAGDA